MGRGASLESSAVETGLWDAYERGEPGAVNDLVVHYLPLVRMQAHQLVQSARSSHRGVADPLPLDEEDLVQAGAMGLRQAILRYRRGRGTAFRSFCAQRIRGAMIDQMRELDWVPRLVRVRSARAMAARDRAAAAGGAPPDDEAMARALGVSESQFRERVAADTRTTMVCSLSAGRGAGSAALPDRDAESPERAAVRASLLELVARGLDREERLVILLYYVEGLTMSEIGHTLGYSESQVSNMHWSVIERLRVRLRGRAEEFT